MKKNRIILIALIISLTGFSFFAFSLIKTPVANHQHESIPIGYHEWMTKNLNVSHFRNGDPIPQARTEQEWKLAVQQGRPAWCFYENNPANEEKYGRLYNWYAVTDPRGLAPEGWRIPIDLEWGELGTALGGEYIAGHKMKAINGWNDSGNGSNASSFNANPGGYRHYGGTFHSMGDNAFWWSVDVYDNDNAMGAYVSKSLDDLYRNFFAKGYGFSVRCVKE